MNVVEFPQNKTEETKIDPRYYYEIEINKPDGGTETIAQYARYVTFAGPMVLMYDEPGVILFMIPYERVNRVTNHGLVESIS